MFGFLCSAWPSLAMPCRWGNFEFVHYILSAKHSACSIKVSLAAICSLCIELGFSETLTNCQFATNALKVHLQHCQRANAVYRFLNFITHRALDLKSYNSLHVLGCMHMSISFLRFAEFTTTIWPASTRPRDVSYVRYFVYAIRSIWSGAGVVRYFSSHNFRIGGGLSCSSQLYSRSSHSSLWSVVL